MAAVHSCGVVVCSCYFFLVVACPKALGMMRYCVVFVGFEWYLNPPKSLVEEGHMCVVRIAADVVVVPKMHCGHFAPAAPSPKALYATLISLIRTTQG